ncbi:recombinase family protein [soil metagenome]
MPSTNGHDQKSDVGRAALYLRVSSDEQRERQSIKTQREFFEQYCKLYNLEVVEVYEDDGVSGTIPLYERPEGRRLLEDAQAKKFETLLVYRLDRLGRSLLVIVDGHDRLLEGAGVALKSATEPIDTSNPSGRLIFQMLASFAEYERETIGERTRAGLHRAFRDGKHTGRIPYGYKLSPDESSLEVVEAEASIVRKIIAGVAEGSTLYREAKRLNEQAVPSPGWRFRSGERKHGGSWSPTTVAAIIRQPAYSGTHEVKINGGESLISREVPATVERSLQERARATLAENKRYPNRKNDRKYLLRGLLICEVCGYTYTGRTSTARISGGTKKYSYYGCASNRAERGTEANASRVPPHRAPHVSAPWVENLVWQDIKQFLENPGETLERVREQLAVVDATGELEARHGDLTKRLAAKQAEKDRYIRLYAQDHISEEELETYLLDLKNQIGNLRLLIESVDADLSRSAENRMAAKSTEAWLLALRERIAEVEDDTDEAFEKRRELAKLLVERIDVGRDENGDTQVRITYRFGPPDGLGEEDGFVADVQNSWGNLAAKRNPSGPTLRQRSTVETLGVP